MIESDPKPFVPDSLVPLLNSILRILSPDELKKLSEACLIDPAFSNLMQVNNFDLAKQIADLAKDAEGSQSTSDAQLNAGL